MSDESGAQDFGEVWRSQPAEKLPVSLQTFVCRRTRELSYSTRVEIIMSIAAALFFAAAIGWRFALDRDRLPYAAFAAVVAWALLSLYWFRDRIWHKEPARKEAFAATCLDFYRKELERRRDHLRNAWLWHGPLLLACVILALVLTGNTFAGYRRLENVLPLLVLLALWTAFGLARRRRQANELQREIDEMERS